MASWLNPNPSLELPSNDHISLNNRGNTVPDENMPIKAAYENVSNEVVRGANGENNVLHDMSMEKNEVNDSMSDESSKSHSRNQKM